ncbi:tetratricopeptide repeat protein [Pedobacter punctiformis]|uniref:Tetratricopeptide repeat protein n=1 Tax=Pedobacter punctiformis TaxID=3004097 RepID=A0ABT4L8B6_9SPHI|nr:tetratricopeptide repeat protein [Pedobacter sp. HCMS5-2]MCZ4244170.1 tetratricopeptide repeat protein [Pedobacter sp. HCMS5-2]
MHKKLTKFSILIVIILITNTNTLLAQNGTTEQNPRTADAFYNRGGKYFQEQKYDLAIADYTKAIALNPKFSDAYLNRGVSYKKKEQYSEALADYAKVIQLEPREPAVYKNQGIIYEIQKNYELAVANYTKAIEFGGKNYPELYIYRGNIYLNNMEKPDLAMADYQMSVKLLPKDATGYNNIGYVYSTKENFTQAITNYTKAIEIDPKFLLAYINRADCYDAIGNTKLADLDRKKYSDLGGEISATSGNTKRSIYPQGSFDAALAKSALSRGLSRIEGRACSKIDGLIFKAGGAKVVLFPVTPYLEEWYALRDKKEGKKISVYMSKEANKYAIEAFTDGEGRFSFEGLKPGKYFIQMIHNFNQLKTNRVYTGSNTAMQGNTQMITNYYRDEDYVVERSQRVERFVEIKKDGEVKKIGLSKGLIKGCDF